MFKKVLVFVLGFVVVLLSSSSSYAEVTANASPAIVGVNTNAPYASKSFVVPTRNLIIRNNDSADYVYVDIKKDSNTNDKSSCYLLAAGASLEFYDFITSGISILRDTTYSTGDTASPISIIATF